MIESLQFTWYVNRYRRKLFKAWVVIQASLHESSSLRTPLGSFRMQCLQKFMKEASFSRCLGIETFFYRKQRRKSSARNGVMSNRSQGRSIVIRLTILSRNRISDKVCSLIVLKSTNIMPCSISGFSVTSSERILMLRDAAFYLRSVYKAVSSSVPNADLPWSPRMSLES